MLLIYSPYYFFSSLSAFFVFFFFVFLMMLSQFPLLYHLSPVLFLWLLFLRDISAWQMSPSLPFLSVKDRACHPIIGLDSELSAPSFIPRTPFPWMEIMLAISMPPRQLFFFLKKDCEIRMFLLIMGIEITWLALTGSKLL